MAEHAKLAPSAAKRWIACPGSIALIEQVPPQPASSYAREGTVAHMLIEKIVTAKDKADNYIGMKFDGYPEFPVTRDMADAVQEFIDYRHQLYEDAGRVMKMVSTEQRVDLDWLYPNMFGKLDWTAYEPATRTLHILDYKHGKGVSVQAVWNEQLMIYALGRLKQLFKMEDSERNAIRLAKYNEIMVHIVIVQPRVFGEDTIREWLVSANELYHWGLNVLRPAAYATEDPNAPRRPGDHCQFCPALSVCSEHLERMSLIAKMDFKNPLLPAPANLTPEELVQVMKASSVVNAWVAEVAAYMQTRMEQGVKIPGFKLVRKRSNRRWVDEKAAEKVLTEALGNNAYSPQQLVSVAQAEKKLQQAKIFNAEIFGSLWEKPDGGLTIAPDSDSRPEAVSSTVAAFIDNCDLLQR